MLILRESVSPPEIQEEFGAVSGLPVCEVEISWRKGGSKIQQICRHHLTVAPVGAAAAARAAVLGGRRRVGALRRRGGRRVVAVVDVSKGGVTYDVHKGWQILTYQ